MERGADKTEIDFLNQFKSNQDAETFIRSRLGDLKKSFDAFEWFMTRDVHPIYGGNFPYMREGVVAASFNAGLSTLKPSWIDQMMGTYKRENIENYPTGINWAMNWLAKETIKLNLPLQQSFVHAVRFEDKMTKGIPNPYEIRYEADRDVQRTLASMGLGSIVNDNTGGFTSILHGRLVEPGMIRGPSDQFMSSQGINIGYTLSGTFSNLGLSASKAGWIGAAAFAAGPLGLAAIPALFYSGKFANDATRDFTRLVSGGQGVDPWKRLTKQDQELGEERAWWKAVKKPFINVGNWMTSINPNEGSAIADKEETNLAKRVSSHFYWYSNEFATPADIPGREHFMFGTGRRVIEPGQQWKIYNLYEFKEQEWKESSKEKGRYQWEYKEPKTSSMKLADEDDLAYATLSIRKRQNTVVDDYFKREQELSYYSPSRHAMGAMINPLIATNFLSSTVERSLNSIYTKVRDVVEEPAGGESRMKHTLKKIGGASAEFFAGAVSTPLNIAAVTLGGTNYIMKCSKCGALVRRDASRCPQCRTEYG
jgi:hypothetical protein